MATPKCNVQSYSWDLRFILKYKIFSYDKIKLKISSVTMLLFVFCFDARL